MIRKQCASFVVTSGIIVCFTTDYLGGAPNVGDAIQFTDRFAPNSLGTLPDGDFIQIGAQVARSSTSDPFENLSVLANKGGFTIPLEHDPLFDLSDDPLYRTWIPFTGDPSSPWSITATDSTGTSAPALTPPIEHPQLVPFATDVSVSDSSTTPNISWSVPNLFGFDVDVTRLRIINADTEVQILQTLIPLATTDFEVPNGILTRGTRYLYRIALEDHSEGTEVENRSNAFSAITRVGAALPSGDYNGNGRVE